MTHDSSPQAHGPPPIAAREQALLSSIVSNLPYGVAWKDMSLHYEGCNGMFASLVGLARPEAVIGLTDADLPWTEEVAEHHADGDGRVLETGQLLLESQETVQRPDGTRAVMLVSRVPLRGKDGRLEGVLSIYADISRLRELETQLTQASRLESIGQLAAGIAHEINTPAQYVSDNTRFLRDSFADLQPLLHRLRRVFEPESGETRTDDPPASTLEEIRVAADAADLGFLMEEIPRALDESLEGLDRVTQIVRAMKEFSHPGEEMSSEDVNRLIESTVTVARNEWKYVADLNLELDPEVGTVPCLAGPLKQVILNMIVNAAHAVEDARSGDGDPKGEITITTRRAAEHIDICIADTGTGIPKEIREKVFDPFFTTKAVGKGTGQGLSIAHAVVVKKHGGEILLDSEVGRGTTFTIRIPLVPAEGLESPGLERAA